MKQQEAMELALSYLRPKLRDTSDVVILVDETLEMDFGWVFFYQSKAYLEGDVASMLVGNAPLIVDRHDGSVHPTGTARPLEFYVSGYAKNRRIPSIRS